MIDARETASDGEFEITQQVEGWARSDDPAGPRGEPRTLLPGTYPVVSQLHERNVVQDADPRGMSSVAEQFYCLDTGEEVFVPARKGTYHPRASGG